MARLVLLTQIRIVGLWDKGAAAALPVWALYMQKVFKDKTLGYSEEEKFDIPSTWTPCGGLATEHKDPLEEGGVDSIFQ